MKPEIAIELLKNEYDTYTHERKVDLHTYQIYEYDRLNGVFCSLSLVLKGDNVYYEFYSDGEDGWGEDYSWSEGFGTDADISECIPEDWLDTVKGLVEKIEKKALPYILNDEMSVKATTTLKTSKI